MEIEGESSGKSLVWRERFERFLELGTREIVRFDYQAPAGSRLHVWDRIEDDLVERVIEGDTTPCLSLGLHWKVRDLEGIGPALRLSRDAAGTDLVLSSAETAQQRVAELEAMLAVPPADAEDDSP